jgi:pimeloyl-ACP methyl ester carboxylesterase
MLPDMRNGPLQTDEATLYYTIRGSGPLLLILQGGSGNADGAEELANQLAGDFTVVTYDRRGLSRSTPIQAERYDIAAHGDDAARLITALTDEPAFVFGSSIGALIGLELAAHYGALVRTLIAHEPPVLRLLEGVEQGEALRRHTEVLETFQRDGIAAAMKLMVALAGVDINDREPEVMAPALAADPKVAAQRFADLKHFLTWDVPAVTRYQPDIAALTAAGSRIIPAAGSSSSATMPGRCATAVAAVLGLRVAEFPGGHSAYVLRPRAFAARLRELLRQTCTPDDAVRELGCRPRVNE